MFQKVKQTISGLFAVDSVSYAVLAVILAVAFVWGLAELFVWLHNITPWWVKLPIAVLFAISLFKQMRKDQLEQNKIDQEQPTSAE